MKNLKLKTKDIVNAYQVLGDASYEKMADEDKIKVWKIARALKPIATKYEDDRNDAQKKLISDETFMNNLQRAQLYEKLLKEGSKDLPMSAEEYTSLMKDFKKYMVLMEAALVEYAEAEVTIEFNPLSEVAFSQLMASNNWSLKQVDLLEFILE